MNIHVTNLNTATTEEDLKNLFSPFGKVESAEIVNDLFTGTSRGFGFVEMSEASEAEKAIAELNKTELNGKQISVLEAKPKEVHKGSYKVGSGIINEYRFRKK